MIAGPLRVLIVDDSRIFRSVIEEALSNRTDVQVVGSVFSGEKALEFARSSPPDFVTLDVEMPGIGGMETLRGLREIATRTKHPVGVLLISSHTKRGAAVTIEGLQEGAFDFIHKPESPDTFANAESLRSQLFEKIDAFVSRYTKGWATLSSTGKSHRVVQSVNRYRAVLIGSSTGGPEALSRLLPVLAPKCPVPIFLVQHFPADFTEYFVASLSRRCGINIQESRDGCIVEPGVVYVARGGIHMVLNKVDGQVAIGSSESPSENGCRPAADVLFRSASVAYAGQVLAVVLTGMGCDGANGAVVLKRAGARVLVQDEPSSIVWGMPGSVVASGAADEILPIGDIGSALLGHLGIGE